MPKTFLPKLLSCPPYALALIFVLLVSANLWATFFADDYFQLLLLQDKGFLQRGGDGSLFGLFSFVDDNAEHRQQLFNLGVLPWFASEDFYFRFWRPIAELSHYLDFVIAPNNAVFAHAHNMVSFLLLAVVFYRLMRLMLPDKNWAYLAFIIFLFSGKHVATIAWIANRNAIIAAIWLCLSLYYFIAWRRQTLLIKKLFSLCCFVLALLSNEASLALLAFVACYLVFLENGNLRQRWQGFWPYLLVFIIWFLLYHFLGFGSGAAGGLYISPAQQPLAFVEALLQRLPVYFAASFLPMPAGIVWGSTVIAPWFPVLVVGFCWFFVIAFLVYFYQAFKQNRYLLFFLSVAVLAFIPLCAGLAQDRLSLIPSLFIAPVIAGLLMPLIKDLPLTPSRHKILTYLLIIHLLLSPLHLLAGSLYMSLSSWQLEKNALNFIEKGQLQGKQLIVLQMPIGQAVSLMGIRDFYHYDSSQFMLWLASDEVPIQIKKLNSQQLQIDNATGFATDFAAAFGQRPFYVGEVISQGFVTLSINQLNAKGQATSIILSSPEGLASDKLLFYRWQQGQLKPIDITTIGRL